MHAAVTPQHAERRHARGVTHHVTPSGAERLKMLRGSDHTMLPASDGLRTHGINFFAPKQLAVTPQDREAIRAYVERCRMHRHSLRTLFLALGHDAGGGLVAIDDVRRGLRHAGLAPSHDVWALLETALRTESQEDESCPPSFVGYSHFVAAFHCMGAQRRFERIDGGATAATAAAAAAQHDPPGPRQLVLMRAVRENLQRRFQGSDSHIVRLLYRQCEHAPDGSVSGASLRGGVERTLGIVLSEEQVGWFLDAARAVAELVHHTDARGRPVPAMTFGGFLAALAEEELRSAAEDGLPPPVTRLPSMLGDHDPHNPHNYARHPSPLPTHVQCNQHPAGAPSTAAHPRGIPRGDAAGGDLSSPARTSARQQLLARAAAQEPDGWRLCGRLLQTLRAINTSAIHFFKSIDPDADGVVTVAQLLLGLQRFNVTATRDDGCSLCALLCTIATPPSASSMREIDEREFLRFARSIPTPEELREAVEALRRAAPRGPLPAAEAAAAASDAMCAADWIDRLSPAAKGSLLAAVRREQHGGGMRHRAFRVALSDLHLPIGDAYFATLVAMLDERGSGTITSTDLERALGWGASRRVAAPTPAEHFQRRPPQYEATRDHLTGGGVLL